MRLLRHHSDFRRLWAGDVLSKAGGQVLLFAVPVLAAVVLNASTWQVGLLSTFAGLPYVMFGLVIGAWADRTRRRPVLIAADTVRAVAIAWIPLAAALDILAIEQFLLRTVGLSPGTIGLLMIGPGVGSVTGAMTATWIGRRIGRVRTVLIAGVGMGLFSLLIPLAANGARLAFYVVGAAMVSYSITVTNVTAVSLRQILCPDELLGRMNATSRFLAWATLPLGGIVGGALGTVVGLRGTLWISAAGIALCGLGLVSARSMRVRDLVVAGDVTST